MIAGKGGLNAAPMRLPSDQATFAGNRWPESSSISTWSPGATPKAPWSCSPPAEKSRIDTVW
jgi:hypothetical protein